MLTTTQRRNDGEKRTPKLNGTEWNKLNCVAVFFCVVTKRTNCTMIAMIYSIIRTFNCRKTFWKMFQPYSGDFQFDNPLPMATLPTSIKTVDWRFNWLASRNIRKFVVTNHEIERSHFNVIFLIKCFANFLCINFVFPGCFSSLIFSFHGKQMLDQERREYRQRYDFRVEKMTTKFRMKIKWISP